MNYIGWLPGTGYLIRRKKQRKKGRSKNVYFLGMSHEIYHSNKDFIDKIGLSFGGVPDSNSYSFEFAKRVNAEKAWVHFVLKFS